MPVVVLVGVANKAVMIAQQFANCRYLTLSTFAADEAALRANTHAQGAKRRTNLADLGMGYRS